MVLRCMGQSHRLSRSTPFRGRESGPLSGKRRKGKRHGKAIRKSAKVRRRRQGLARCVRRKIWQGRRHHALPCTRAGDGLPQNRVSISGKVRSNASLYGRATTLTPPQWKIRAPPGFESGGCRRSPGRAGFEPVAGPFGVAPLSGNSPPKKIAPRRKSGVRVALGHGRRYVYRRPFGLDEPRQRRR